MKKTLIWIAVLALPIVSFANDPHKKMGHDAKMMDSQSTEIKLMGVTDANRRTIEQIAKDAGAKKATVDVMKGSVMVTPMNDFNKDTFVASLRQKVPGVTVTE